MAKKAVKKTLKKKETGFVKAKNAEIVKAKKIVSPTKKLAEEPKATPTVPVVKVLEQPVEKVFKPVVYQGVKIVRVLDSGHTKTMKKVEGVDRNGNVLTLHVPAEIL